MSKKFQASSQDKKWENPQSFSLWLNMCWILREIFSVINSGWWGITRRVAVPVHDQFWVSASALHFLQILKRNKIFFEKFKNSSETMKHFLQNLACENRQTSHKFVRLNNRSKKKFLLKSKIFKFLTFSTGGHRCKVQSLFKSVPYRGLYFSDLAECTL